MTDNISEDLKSGALFYHRYPRPGKLEIQATKPLGNQRDLALAYSPGVAAACEAIARRPGARRPTLTSRQNLVAVISNGTAVLGLGDIGPLASKPVMEGKAVLFKKFAGIDVFDIEVAEKDVDKLVEVVAALEPTFGGINLEDIKAPECFEVEERLKARMGIPVFHDDQHGTAIIVGAAVTQRAGARRQAHRGGQDRRPRGRAPRRSPASTCSSRSARSGRTSGSPTSRASSTRAAPTLMDRWKSAYAQTTEARTLAEVIVGADVFLGLSAGGVLKAASARGDGSERPLILALANPNPEIMPEEAEAARPDAMICTGRSDYPNQVNNVLCFPYIFRGALDVGATHHQRGDEGGGGQGDRRARPRGALRGGRPRLWRRGASVRAEVADPEPVRSRA